MNRINRRDLLVAAAGGAAVWLVARPLAAAGASPAQSGFPFTLSDAEWRRRLGPAAYAVLRQGETERPGTSPLVREHRPGNYHCAGCANHYSARAPNMTAGRAGRAFMRRSAARSGRGRTEACSSPAPRFIAAAAGGIWATSSTTAQDRLASATA